MSNLVKVSTEAGMPYMYKTVAPQFEQLREDVRIASGRDFLEKCGDVLRAPGFISNKDGVANRSNHKTGRAFDYDQTVSYLIIQKEPIGNKMYFRTYIKCTKQDGSMGQHRKLNDYRKFGYSGYTVDFTEFAKACGFSRIPAWNGWESHYNRREFWHYQDMEEGGKILTWNEAMLMLVDKTVKPEDRIWGLNDRGDEVKRIQQKLADLGILPTAQVDGVFGVYTKAAVIQFQKNVGFTGKNVDGKVGPMTYKQLFKGE